MRRLQRLESWVEQHRVELGSCGDLRFVVGPKSHANPSAQLLISHRIGEVELLLWESGEAEFTCGLADSYVSEHVEAHTSEELDTLLQRFQTEALRMGRPDQTS